MSSSALVRQAIVAEASFGAGAGASPAFETLVWVSGGPAIGVDSLVDDSHRGDRHRAGVDHGNQAVSGELQCKARYGGYDTLLQALLQGTWTDDVLVPGSTRRSFLWEQYFADLGAGNMYHRYDGLTIASANISLATNKHVDLSFGLKGRTMTPAATAIANSTYGDPSTNAAFNYRRGAITEGGAPLAIVSGFSFAIDNGMSDRNVVGSQTTLEPSDGTIIVKGNLEVWFDGAAGSALVGKFIGETETALTFTFEDGAGQSHLWTIPALKYVGGIPTLNNNAPVPVSLAFEAYYDAVSETSISLTRDDGQA